MKTILIVAAVIFSAQTVAFANHGKMASDELVQKALDNPARYLFDDGGNINFGNGIFKRRIAFSGKPQACYLGNFLYAGTAEKCVNPVYSGDEQVGCEVSKIVELKTQMQGSYQICTQQQNDNGDNSDCQKYSTVKFNKGPRVRVKIYKKSQMNDHNDYAGFKGYAYLMLPECNDF